MSDEAVSDPQAPTAVVRLATDGASEPAWRLAVSAMVGALIGILWLYRDTAMAMAEIWGRSETFAHGFVVLPIVVWLVWRARSQLAELSPRPRFLGLLPMAVAGFAWLVAELAAVNAGTQFALVALLVLAVPAVLGIRVARTLLFPLAFMFFAVPFGEFVMPQLMQWTADFTVIGLRLSGVPVYREGLHFVIPSGNWSVVEACSGVRYLIASVTVGTLFAHVSYRSRKRQLVFIGLSLLVPIVANWIRAYMIVMLGHLSGNKIAAGVDHLIYGWVFFGVVILIMFWIGSRWREDHLPDSPRDGAPGLAAADAGADTVSLPFRSARVWLVATSAVALAAVWPVWYAQIVRSDSAARVEINVPAKVGNWTARTEPLSDWRPQFVNPAYERLFSFTDDKRVVGLYVGYYRQQGAARKLVSSTNVLVHSDDRFWARVSSGTEAVELGQQRVDIRTAELRGAPGERLVVWQWYWVNGWVTASDYRAKVMTAFSRLAGQGDDGAVIILYALKDLVGGGDATLKDFTRSAWPAIESALSQAKEGR